MDTKHFADLPDAELITEVQSLAACERSATVALIAAIGEVDARRLYRELGYSSLFVFCTKRLRLSEHAAYGRITAARAAQAWPLVLTLLEDGSITLTTVVLLASHLTAENHTDLLAAAVHKSKREVEQQVATLRPQPPVATMVRRMPTPAKAAPASVVCPPSVPVTPPTRLDLMTDAGEAQPRGHVAERDADVHSAEAIRANAPCDGAASRLALPVQPAVIAPLSPERYKVQLTITRETHDKLRRVQDLMRHTVPNGDPAVIFDRALSALLDALEKRKLARARNPRPQLTKSRRGKSGARATCPPPLNVKCGLATLAGARSSGRTAGAAPADSSSCTTSSPTPTAAQPTRRT